ncbi:hypothetical protein BAY06_12820 [Elizabethkingia anophelis]|uniref:hypothetical protein n=1 Tax=Elizabethkingia anophelis TaxID=1117645 RepID=UPI0009993111|nr:hypothetical protein [Elizabethkingia anophelis]OPC54597.1 hypothetical protein BAY06_12820 [Elizabethkingia anophelis]
MSIIKLEKIVIAKAKSLKNQHKYPASIIGAKYSYFRKIDRSGPISPNIIVKKLRDQLNNIGELYTKHNGNTLGCCAEINASNQILERRPKIELKSIIFTKAIRPRTMQIIPTCKNCKLTFN